MRAASSSRLPPASNYRLLTSQYLVAMILKRLGNSKPALAVVAALLGMLGADLASAGADKTVAPPAVTGKSGAQIWAENCQRCHNLRSPASYSPAQWEVAMLHMRIRAKLTPEQHDKVLAFLKSGA